MNTYLVMLLFPCSENRRIKKIKESSIERALKKAKIEKCFEEEIISIVKEEK